jgi:glycosyltransferase involved in cell wall biosynthesis
MRNNKNTTKDKKRICFFLSDVDVPYEGVARPFVNWAKQIPKYNYDVFFVLLNCGTPLKRLTEELNDYDNRISSKSVSNFSQLLECVRITRPDVIITDDKFSRLRYITKIKDKINIQTCIYIQVLFSIHSISDIFTPNSLHAKRRIVYKIIRSIPFNFLKNPYKKLLQRQDIIISNSYDTARLLETLYGIESNEVIYPAVDTTVFRPHNLKKLDQVLIYLGSHYGDTDETFVREICTKLDQKGFEILAIGNKELMNKLRSEFKIRSFFNISDNELARIYSQCKLTVCPQKWELFGYPAAESISCRTPVVAFINCTSLLEIMRYTKLGIMVNNKKEYLLKLCHLNLNKIDQYSDKPLLPYVCNAEYTGAKLVNAIEEVIASIFYLERMAMAI